MAPSHRMTRTLPRRKRTLITVAITASLVLAGGTAAFAYWSAQGSGTSSATTASSTAFTISSGKPAGALTPGGDSETVAFTVKNPGTATQQLSGLTVTVALADGSAWAVNGCSAADYQIDTLSFTPGQIKGSETLSGTFQLRMLNSNVSQDGCQGVTVPLYFAAN